MQKSEKSFLISLLLSFVFAFSVAAYLSSPFAVHVQTVKASADTLPADQIEPREDSAAATPGIPFSSLNLISLIEIPNELTFASSTATSTDSQGTIAHEETARAAAQKAVSAPKSKTLTKVSARPVRLIIPSIGLNTEIDPVGLNDKGEMAVPEGTSDAVGWYKNGTIPGNVGSAVIDAHVFAAFEELRYLKVGSEVYVENSDGQRLTFVVNDSRVYKLGELTSGMLFGKKDARRLNLITCAGSPTTDGSTYTHRLVVYTTRTA